MERRTVKKMGLAGLCTALIAVAIPQVALSADAIVYSVYKGVDLGAPNEELQKDYFVNLGTNQGVEIGATLEVARRNPSYDLTTEKLYKDLVFPFARLRVIHAEKDASIARVEKLYAPDKTPVLIPRAVIVGDLVRKIR